MSESEQPRPHNTLVDGVRLSIGMFTIIRVPAPSQVNKPRAALALLFAPFAFALWALLVGIVLAVGIEIGLPALVLATIGVLLLVLGNRAFHLDGLADTVDAFAASYERERALEVARLGNVGPAGVAAIVLVLMLQVTAGAALLEHRHGVWAFVALACVARVACTTGAMRGVPAARAEGLGESFSGSVPRWAAMIAWLSAIAATWAIAFGFDIANAHPIMAALAAGALIAVLVRRCVDRLGGIIGDALGASIEIAFAILLLGFAF